MRWLFSTVAKHGFWPNAKHGCLATTSLAPMALSQALFIQKPWIDKILDEGKTWEIRGYLTNKRQRFYLAESKANLLKGEASLINCKLVAVKDGNGDWVPAGNTEQDQLDFFMNECNYKKMGFNPVTDMPICLHKCDKLYAWVLGDIIKYQVPVSWKPKRGPIIWCSVNQPSNLSKPNKPKAVAKPVKKQPSLGR